jgi:flagellar biosynthesis protein FlhG
MENQLKHWCIEHRDHKLGPISSYALALWGLQGLLYPNDVISRDGQRRFLAGYLPGMTPFIRNDGHLKRAKFWAVAGGKGGVGKSIFCALLGIAIAGLDKRVVIVDADFGGPNQHDIFGIKVQPGSYWQYIDEGKNLHALAQATGFKNLRIIPGSEEAYDPQRMHVMRKIKLVQALRNLDADYVIMDLGPRTGQKDLDFFLTADLQILLSTAEPTSMENLSRIIKALVLRKTQTAFSSLSRKPMPMDLDYATGSSSFVEGMIEHMRSLNMPADEIFRRILGSFNIRLIFNMVESADYAKQAHLLNKYLGHELGLTFHMTGCIRQDPTVHEALQARDMNRMTSYSNRAFQDILELTQKLMVARSRAPEQPHLKTVKAVPVSKNAIVCSKTCHYWKDCSYQTPGYYCQVRNWN